MKSLWIVGLGIAIWNLSLLWPGINRIPMWPVMIGVILGIGGLVLALIIDKVSQERHSTNRSGQNHPSRPVRVTGIR